MTDALRRRVSQPDRSITILAVLTCSICAAMFVTTAGDWLYWIKIFHEWALYQWTVYVLPLLALATGAAAATRLAHLNAKGRLTRRALIICLVGLVIAVRGAIWWFSNPLYAFTFTLRFGGDDRWGCCTVDQAGNPHYIINSETAPWMLFGPLIVLIAWRGWRAVRRR
jgi:hypothetical protein